MAEQVAESARLSAEGHNNGTLVEFKQDVFPHVKGDIKKLDKKELSRMDDVAKANNLKGDVYVEVKASKTKSSDEKA